MVKHSTVPNWTYQETKQNLLTLPDPRMKILSIMLYVCCARLNEAYPMRPKDIQPYQDEHPAPNTSPNRIKIELLTLKNPHIDKRYTGLSEKNEPEYYTLINQWKQDNQPLSQPFKQMSMGERHYRYQLRKTLDIHPHALRHLRVHHLLEREIPNVEAFNVQEFQDYGGWANIQTAAHYQRRSRARLTHTKF